MSAPPQTILITGASAGIGKAAVARFVAEGWTVAATMRTPGAFVAPAGPGRAKAFALDVTDQASITRAIAAIDAEFGAINALVNNAGYGLVGPFEAMDETQIRRQFETNVFGLMAVTRAVLPGMRQRRSGRIINVASVGGRITFPYYSCYHATKWAVDGFSESLAFELKPFGIGVKIIEPGPIKTEFYDRSEDQPPAGNLGAYADHFRKTYARMRGVGMKAPGPEIVADAIWQAATENRWRLRISPNAQMILAMRALFGDTLFHRGVRRVLRTG
jgi:NAD(P)-dependent dehydrogenase (short-subunit alcohol dehydrogenase family)